jgi:hypothetical protein
MINTAGVTGFPPHLECSNEPDDVLMSTCRVQANLAIDLVLVKLTDAAHEVTLEHYNLT